MKFNGLLAIITKASRTILCNISLKLSCGRQTVRQNSNNDKTLRNALQHCYALLLLDLGMGSKAVRSKNQITEKSFPNTDNKTRYGDEASLSYISSCSKRNLKYFIIFPLYVNVSSSLGFEIFKPQIMHVIFSDNCTDNFNR